MPIRSASRLLLLAALALTAACERGPAPEAYPVRPPDEVSPAGTRSKAPVSTIEVVTSFPHDTAAFTQGLEFHDGALYESTGLEGRSSLRHVELESGRVLQEHHLAPQYFAEGLTIVGDRIFQLTWKNGRGFIYDLATLAPVDSFSYAGEGWGLAHDGRHLIMSDGTATLRFLDPKTYQEVRRVEVKEGDAPLYSINELEYVNGELLANIWQTDWIARIDPETGRLKGWIDLRGLLPATMRTGREDVLNGIAYDSTTQRLFVTGKLWPRLFEVRIKG
jgi:glutamine cyclotransferase